MTQQQDQSEAGVDWEGMRPDWEAGIVSVSELERRFKVTRTAIRKHWKKAGIERRLKGQIDQETDRLVERAEAGRPLPVPPARTEHPSDAQTVTTNAVLRAGVILRQRTDIRRAQDLCGQLLTELESQTFDRALYQELDTVLRKAAGSGKSGSDAIKRLTALYQRVTTTTARIDNTKKLAETMKLLVELERVVLGIGKGEGGEDPAAAGKNAADAVVDAMTELKNRFRERLGTGAAA